MRSTDKNNKQTGVEVRVTGNDGNIFAIMGQASQAMKQAGWTKKAKQMCKEASHTHSYGEAIATISEFVELS